VSAEPPPALEAIAAEAFGLLGTGRQVQPFSERHPGFDLEAAYRVTGMVRQLREARGERAVGRKIGFSNRSIWAEYRVHAPIWGYLYDRTVLDLDRSGARGFSLAGLPEPKIEPEIVFHLRDRPEPGMDELHLLGCIDWMAHGFEIVQSVFPGWRFAAADTVAACGLHAALLLGPRVMLPPDAGRIGDALSRFGARLERDGALVAEGHAANVLGSPLAALQHLVELLARDPVNPPLAAGEIVTTGTVTAAMPISAGQAWASRLDGMELADIALRFD